MVKSFRKYDRLFMYEAGIHHYMARSEDAVDDSEAEMLPDERAVIAERAAEVSELDDDEFVSVDELAEELDIDRDE